MKLGINGVLLPILILKAVLLRNLYALVLWIWDMQFHSVVSGVAFISTMEKSTESAKVADLVHAQLAETAPNLQS